MSHATSEYDTLILHSKDQYLFSYLLAIWDSRSLIKHHAKVLRENFGFKPPLELKLNYDQVFENTDNRYAIKINTLGLLQSESSARFISRKLKGCAITNADDEVTCFINGEAYKTGLKSHQQDAISSFAFEKLGNPRQSDYEHLYEDSCKLKDALDGEMPTIINSDNTDPSKFIMTDLLRIAQLDAVLWTSEEPASKMMAHFKSGINLKNLVLTYNLIQYFNKNLGSIFQISNLRKQKMDALNHSFKSFVSAVLNEAETSSLTPKCFFSGLCKPFEEDSMSVIKSAYNTHSMSAQMNKSESLKIKRRQHL